ncbi:hypothetical protein AVEN_229502-1, partial [Araneus ventricosus]
KAVSSLDPCNRRTSVALESMKELPLYASNVVQDSEKEAYDLEIHNFQNDRFSDIVEASVDLWWRDVENTSKYPLLSRMAFALLTCFHEPKVESSFIILNNVITPGSNRLNVSTFNAMQCIKYELRLKKKKLKKSAVCMFSKHDFLKEKVDPKLVRNVRNSRNVYFDKLKQNKSLREERIKELNASKEKALTKKRCLQMQLKGK